MKNRQNNWCNYPPNETIFLGAELVRGQVGQGPNLLGAEFIRARDVPESSVSGP